MVSKDERHLHIEMVVDVGVDEEISERFVDWHQDYFLSLFEELFDYFDWGSVDVETMDRPTH